MSARTLVIEDETRVAHPIERGFVASRFDVVVAGTGEEGCFLLSSQAFDMVILDLMLSGRDGLEILRTVRRHGSTMPILILSARDTVPDRVNGFQLSADDYLVMPFVLDEPACQPAGREPGAVEVREVQAIVGEADSQHAHAQRPVA